MSEISTPKSARHNFDLLANYSPAKESFDELLSANGEPRRHYLPLLDHLDSLGPEELRRRADTCRRLLHEGGVTYNVYGDARGMERPWQLNPVPFLMAANEWRSLETALIQRATLLNLVLADCYGSQELLRSGRLPPALVFGQPDFLRSCHGIKQSHDTYLHFYAVDLARSPDGQWWVVSDRTNIPTGAGYALANRLIISRLLPDTFRDGHVQRLASFFRGVRNSLAQLAARHTDNPRIVLLTPGPYNETYFEQAYLARYLGYMLVEGQDLTVRDDRVFLKTLSGLEPVDVILRRVDDEFCDPLELRNDSMLGVPGLVEALRAGNVAVTNSLGSGLLQQPAFLGFLPSLCRHLLGEDLKLPSVATWWCGQQTARDYVLKHLDDLFVKSAFRSERKGSNPERDLTQTEREVLARAIRFQPHQYVAQERVVLSSAPAWGEQGLTSRPVALRVYLVATDKGYQLMPGGLTRVASETSGRFVSMQRGGTSMDTWVLSDKPVEPMSLLTTPSNSIDLRRVGNNLPSRMADNFYWMGRYAERSDFTARMLRAALVRFGPETTSGALPFLEPLLETLESQGQLTPGEAGRGIRANHEALEADLLAAIFDPARPGSLRHIAENLQRLAVLVRDRTSSEVWRVLSSLADTLSRPTSSLMLAGEAVGILQQAMLSLAAFSGLARENMTRAHGWRFLDMGRRIERGVYLCTFLENALGSSEANNPSLLETLLDVCDCAITYRARYNLLPNIAAVYDLVLLDDTNPRSLLFQLNQLVKHCDRLPQERESALPSAGQRVLIESLARLRLLDPRELNTLSGGWHDSETGTVISATLRDLPRLSDAIAVSYFAHSAISRADQGGSQ